MSGQKERLTIVNQSIDWNVFEYMDLYGNPVDGIFRLSRPDKLANKRIYGFNLIQLGEKVWVVDGSDNESSVPVHLEELELEKKTKNWEVEVEKPESPTCPECGGIASGKVCAYCGTGLKTNKVREHMMREIDMVVGRGALEPELIGDVNEGLKGKIS